MKESLAHCIVYRVMVESGTCIVVRSKEKDQQQWRMRAAMTTGSCVDIVSSTQNNINYVLFAI